MSQNYNFPLFYADFFHKIKYYIQNLRCLITILLQKYYIFAIEKYLQQNVFKTLIPDISVPYCSNIMPSSTYVFISLAIFYKTILPNRRTRFQKGSFTPGLDFILIYRYHKGCITNNSGKKGINVFVFNKRF